MSKYRPIRKPLVYCPQAPSVTCGDSSLPEGAMGCCVSIWGGALGSGCCGIPQSRLRRASSLWQGSLWVRRRYWVKFRENVKIDKYQRYLSIFGGDYRTRTCDLMRVKHAL